MTPLQAMIADGHDALEPIKRAVLRLREKNRHWDIEVRASPRVMDRLRKICLEGYVKEPISAVCGVPLIEDFGILDGWYVRHVPLEGGWSA